MRNGQPTQAIIAYYAYYILSAMTKPRILIEGVGGIGGVDEIVAVGS